MKNRLLIAIFSMLIFWGNNTISAQVTDVYKQQRQQWLKKAAEAKPPLIKQIKKPISLVKAVKDSSAYQGWKMNSYLYFYVSVHCSVYLQS